MAAAIPKALAIATEPFFRRDLGHRYLDSTSMGMAAVLWLAATGLCTFGGMYVSQVFHMVGIHSLARLLNRGNTVSFFIGLIISGAFVILALRNRQGAIQRHYAGSPRHSMSRGEPRIKNPYQYECAQVGVVIFLLGFAAPLGLLFIASRLFNAQLMAKQQEAIMARYLDAIDAKIETQYLESALLGETEPETTYLYQPLSKSIPDGMRKNIAAAAAGSPVKIVAQAPKALPVTVAR